jgi:lipopolysaccharide transport system permease protein
MSSTTARRPLLVIEPPSPWAALEVSEVWRFRDLLVALAARDVKLRYRQTVLGVAWVMLQPLLAAAIFAFVFGRVAKLPSEGAPYFVFAFAGMMGWNAFGQTITKAGFSLIGNAHLVSKVYFPRLILPLSTLFSTLIDFAVALVLVVGMMVWYGINPGWAVLTLPVWLALLLLLAMGVSFFVAALMVSYRDVQYVVPVVLQLLTYASPVAYAVSAVPERFRDAYMLNPLAGLLQVFRWSLLGAGEVHWGWVGYSAGMAVAVFVIGAYAFRRMERQFADVI